MCAQGRRRRAGRSHRARRERPAGGDVPLRASLRLGERALGRAASSGFRIGLLAGPHDPG